MTDYVLTSAAEADLRGIIRYTRSQWGDEQLRRYIDTLEHTLVGVARGLGTYRPMESIAPDLRMVRCEHHFVFCLPRPNASALIIAIFHEGMDLMAPLAERL
ncbi:type II toxin-antitoxin system RelE/ParE family toxin [Acetobacter oeni]|uniref:type II toxin-antitoxin system RelE/ParE family toxin n=1 Tax=Acetobacter oeni TaxID=304077 RepID=UPI0011BE36AB|nr:type II toxin-antitoxin system RelE/ParE family toxin [Acetobacter oeni]MBB3884432.1 plasmid stabilization system protein ParE [Acetobacter oeni]NHO20379.1 type II toxin-antitoxin system RelE/ParE family toxin [Acetobacter oeni]GBR01665.1 plasmid stabilization system protein [Acetobacter oeni LMG 21952]